MSRARRNPFPYSGLPSPLSPVSFLSFQLRAQKGRQACGLHCGCQFRRAVDLTRSDYQAQIGNLGAHRLVRGDYFRFFFRRCGYCPLQKPERFRANADFGAIRGIVRHSGGRFPDRISNCRQPGHAFGSVRPPNSRIRCASAADCISRRSMLDSIQRNRLRAHLRERR